MHNPLPILGWSLFFLGQAVEPSLPAAGMLAQGGALVILATWLWCERQSRLAAQAESEKRTSELIDTLKALRGDKTDGRHGANP